MDIDHPLPDIEAGRHTKPKEHKVCFYVFYVISFMLYVTLVLVTSCKQPFIPEHDLSYYLPIFDKDLVNLDDKMKQTVNLNITFYNRNTLTSFTYDDLNITMYYLDSRSDTSVYVTSNLEPGFIQYQPNHKEVYVHMHAPGLSGLLQQQEQLNTTMDFRVDLQYNARFHCRSLCKNKHRFSWYWLISV